MNIQKSIYPWLIISLSSIFLFYKYILQLFPSVVTHELMTTFAINATGLGSLAASYFYTYSFMQLFAGILLDKYSPRLITTFAISICALGSILFAHASSLSLAVFSRMLIGIGAAFAMVSYMKLSSLYFNDKYVSFVDGLSATACMLGALCGQLPLVFLIEYTSWRGALIYCGIFGIAFSALYLLIVKTKNNTNVNSVKRSNYIIKDIVQIFKNKNNWLLACYAGLVYTPVAVLGGLWGNPFFQVLHNLTNKQASFCTSMIFLGLAIGGPTFGYIAGRINKLKLMIFGTTLALMSLLICIYASFLSFYFLIFFLFSFGFNTGSFISCYTLAKKINSLKIAATLIALINTGDALISSFTEPLIGKILDMLWSGKIVNGIHYFSVANYQIALSLLPIYLLLSIVCLLMLKKNSIQTS